MDRHSNELSILNPGPSRSPQLTIAMADDDANSPALMAMAAKHAGMDIDFTFVENGLELIDHLHSLGRNDPLPDLIVLDLMMPVMDGHGVLDELQARPRLATIPVVVFSSSIRRDDRRRSLSAGAHWFETKPTDFESLVQVVRSFPRRANPMPSLADSDRYPISGTVTRHDGNQGF